MSCWNELPTRHFLERTTALLLIFAVFSMYFYIQDESTEGFRLRSEEVPDPKKKFTQVPLLTMPDRLKGKPLPFHKVYESRRVGFTKYESTNYMNTNSTKLILFWTSWNHVRKSINYYYLLLGNKSFTRHGCPNPRCVVVRKRKLIRDADAVIFHLLDTDPKDMPRYRRPNQVWILYNMEPPWLVERRNLRLDLLNDRFNLTMTYRQDADIQVRYGYVDSAEKKTDLTDFQSLYKNKSKMAAWFVSDCHTDGKRENYVKELAKYIDVDIYGRCGPMKCFPAQSSTCYDELLTKYKFYLSFENAICEDYVTEKFFNAFNHHVIPVVFGGAKYKKLVPHDSYINAVEYQEPRALARKLLNIASKAELYTTMLRRKAKFVAYLDPWMCRLCDKLHDDKTYAVKKTLGDVRNWLMGDNACSRWIHGRGYVHIPRNNRTDI